MTEFQAGSQLGVMTQMSDDELKAVQTKELDEISTLSIEALKARIDMYEQANRLIFIRIGVTRKHMHAKLASMTDEEIQKLNLKIPGYMRGNPGEKPKLTKAAKQHKDAQAALAKIGIGGKDMAELMAKLGSIGKNMGAKK